jgi:hypothetical protein
MRPTPDSTPPSTVLLDDDEEFLRRLLSRILTEAGFGVVEAENGAVARSYSSPAAISPPARMSLCPPESSSASLSSPRHFSLRCPNWSPTERPKNTQRSGACRSSRWIAGVVGTFPHTRLDHPPSVETQ